MDTPVYGLILASGQGSRMGGALPKQFRLLGDRPILAHTLQAFDAAKAVDVMVLSAAPSFFPYIQENILRQYPTRKPVLLTAGGSIRQESVFLALTQICGDGGRVAIHDGVRPLVMPQVIDDTLAAADQYGAAAAGVPMKDTVKWTDAEGFIESTPARSRLWQIQTPQSFRMGLILEAHQTARREGVTATDDSALAERLGIRVKLIYGGYDNIKITTPEDLAIAAYILKNREELYADRDRI